MDNLYNLVIDAVFDSKALDIVSIDISEVSIMADYFIICSGRSRTHIQGIANNILEKIKDNNFKLYNISGYEQADWVLIDLGNLVVHVMNNEIRNFYKLEKLWSNGKIIYLDEDIKQKAN
ncbi:MAG: ribosomal silencing factor RsfS [Candidatus Sericytochromatia bacterium]|nr:MAG: ribosomal silencing factor RsfS [Candidatus Sericytochromatia bacterium]